MDSNNRRQVLLKKYLRNECTEKEIQELISFFDDADFAKDFPGVEEVLNQLEDVPELTIAADRKMFRQIVLAKNKQKRKSFTEAYKLISVAAAFLGLLLISYFYQDLGSGGAAVEIQPQGNQITLRLGDGKVESIDTADKIIRDSKGKHIGTLQENRLIYDKEGKTDSLIYNELTVPYGKTFDLLLADGTNVHLNAGTSFRFPVKFIEGRKREVFLKGEAYFDVVKDELHPFSVNAEDLNIQVLGTRFAVASYPEESKTQVVLVEGSVGINTEDSDRPQTVLIPGERGVYDKINKQITTDQVSTNAYTSWIQGELMFRDMTFEAILNRLERHYNVQIVNHFKAEEGETVNANFGTEPINNVLEYFKRIYKIEYTVNGDKIIIK